MKTTCTIHGTFATSALPIREGAALHRDATQDIAAGDLSATWAHLIEHHDGTSTVVTTTTGQGPTFKGALADISPVILRHMRPWGTYRRATGEAEPDNPQATAEHMVTLGAVAWDDFDDLLADLAALDTLDYLDLEYDHTQASGALFVAHAPGDAPQVKQDVAQILSKYASGPSPDAPPLLVHCNETFTFHTHGATAPESVLQSALDDLVDLAVIEHGHVAPGQDGDIIRATVTAARHPGDLRFGGASREALEHLVATTGERVGLRFRPVE